MASLPAGLPLPPLCGCVTIDHYSTALTNAIASHVWDTENLYMHTNIHSSVSCVYIRSLLVILC